MRVLRLPPVAKYSPPCRDLAEKFMNDISASDHVVTVITAFSGHLWLRWQHMLLTDHIVTHKSCRRISANVYSSKEDYINLKDALLRNIPLWASTLWNSPPWSLNSHPLTSINLTSSILAVIFYSPWQQGGYWMTWPSGIIFSNTLHAPSLGGRVGVHCPRDDISWSLPTANIKHTSLCGKHWQCRQLQAGTMQTVLVKTKCQHMRLTN